MGDQTYGNYFKRLKGEQVLTHDGDPDAGWYRMPTRTPRDEGSKITGWTRVIYWPEYGKLRGAIGVGTTERFMSANELTDLWTYVCAYPVPHDVWNAVRAGGEWPRNLIGEPKQAHRVAYPVTQPTAEETKAFNIALERSNAGEEAIPAADRAVSKNDNAPPEELPLDQQHAEAIKNAVKAPVSPITSDEQKAEATGRKNRIAELRLAADKDGKALYQPVFNEYKRIYNLYSPLVALAEAKEKEITRAVLTYDESERKRIAKQKADDEAKRLEDERVAREDAERLIDRAIAAGKPASEVIDPGVIGTTLAPVFEAPAPIAPTYGTRTIKAALKKFAEIKTLEDQAKVYEHFKTNADVAALLLKLAQTQVTAGFDVPGVTVREGLI